MSSKREEVKAFERLKELFPARNVSLDCRYESWHIDPYYECYLQGEGKEECSFGRGNTPNEAIDALLKKRKEVLDKLKAKAELSS